MLSLDILQQTFLQNSVLNYLVFLLIFVGGILITKILTIVIFRRLKAWAAKTEASIDDLLVKKLERRLIPLLYFGAFYLGVHTLTLSPSLARGINILGTIFFTLYGISLIISVISHVLTFHWLGEQRDPNKEYSLKVVFRTINVLVWGLGLIFLLDNLGFKITTVIAGLGIGGIAVALASQSILGDLFSYFAILFDRPFMVGDFIVIDNYMGTVEHIGIKTTRIRSLGGEQIVFSNADLTGSRMRNYKRMEKRRVLFKIGVTYQTPLQQLKEIPSIIENIIKDIEGAAFDRAHFSAYGDFSLIFEVVYYVLDSDYTKYMDIQQKINLAIKEEFEKRHIEFAYPTQTLYLNKGPHWPDTANGQI